MSKDFGWPKIVIFFVIPLFILSVYAQSIFYPFIMDDEEQIVLVYFLLITASLLTKESGVVVIPLGLVFFLWPMPPYGIGF
jgi:hypothetical protein